MPLGEFLQNVKPNTFVDNTSEIKKMIKRKRKEEITDDDIESVNDTKFNLIKKSEGKANCSQRDTETEGKKCPNITSIA